MICIERKRQNWFSEGRNGSRYQTGEIKQPFASGEANALYVQLARLMADESSFAFPGTTNRRKESSVLARMAFVPVARSSLLARAACWDVGRLEVHFSESYMCVCQ